MPRRCPKPKRPARRPGESVASLDARWRAYERRLLGDPAMPTRPTIDPELTGVDRSREIAMLAISDRFERVSGIGVLHRNKQGNRYALTITDPNEDDSEMLTIIVGRLANHARRLLFTIESQRFDDDRVRWWIQSIYDDDRAGDALAELIDAGRRLGLDVIDA
ncbi:hypothetical protein [Rubripirellula lacrimiformis]|nr:hypothetical protein [Rubripirellula lacrimiformis]